MKIKEAIAIIKTNATYRHLEQADNHGGFPKIIEQQHLKNIESYKAGNFTVKGMARKHQVANVEILQIDSAPTISQPYLKKTPTTLYRFHTQNGIVYYDFAENKIGLDQTEMSTGFVPDDKFTTVTLQYLK